MFSPPFFRIGRQGLFAELEDHFYIAFYVIPQFLSLVFPLEAILTGEAECLPIRVQHGRIAVLERIGQDGKKFLILRLKRKRRKQKGGIAVVQAALHRVLHVVGSRAQDALG